MVYTNAMDTTAATTELVEWGNVCKAFGYVTRPGVSIGGNAGGVALGVLAKAANTMKGREMAQKNRKKMAEITANCKVPSYLIKY